MKCSESARIVLSDQEIAKPLSSLCPLWSTLHRIGHNDRFHRASPLSAGAEKINPLVLIKFKSQDIDRHDGSLF